MNVLLARAKNELGVPGIVAIGLLAVSTLFYLAAVRPLEEKLARLDRALERTAKRVTPGNSRNAIHQHRQTSLGAFYSRFESNEGKPMWLARIHGIASSSGIDLRAGEYRLADTPGRIERYQITLPVTGSYSQIQAFIESALAEIPTLSLDHVSLRRKSVAESRAEANVSVTLHLLKQ